MTRTLVTKNKLRMDYPLWKVSVPRDSLKWKEQQEECDFVQQISLKRLKDVAARKRKSSLTQKKFLTCVLKM